MSPIYLQKRPLCLYVGNLFDFRESVKILHRKRLVVQGGEYS